MWLPFFSSCAIFCKYELNGESEVLPFEPWNDEKIEDEFNRRLKKAVKRQQKLIASGIRALVYREEPFTTAKDSLEFHVYLMIDEKCRKNRKVRIEEVR